MRHNQGLIDLIHSQNDHHTHLGHNLKKIIENRIEKLTQSRNALHVKKNQLMFTHSLIKGLNHSKNLKDIFKIITKELVQLIPFHDISILVQLPSNQFKLLRAKGSKVESTALPTTFADIPFIKKMFQSPAPALSARAPFNEIKQKGFSSYLTYPLMDQSVKPSRCMATLNLAHRKKSSLHDLHIAKLNNIANPISIAIEKMRIFEIVEQGSREWETTFDAISDLVTVIDKNFHLIKANRATEKIANNRVEKFVGKKCYVVLANRKSPCRNCPALETLQKKKVSLEKEIVDFKDHDYLSWAYPVFNKRNELSSMVVYYRDHTHASKLFRQLIQSEKMAAVGHLASSLAHELNNPLTGITVFSQILKKELGRKHRHHSDISEIEKASLRCKHIIENLLSFSENKPKRKKTHIDLNALINSTLPLVQFSSATSPNISMEKSFAVGLPKIKGNDNELQQVFLNLLLNALQAMPKGGKLSIKTAHLPKKSMVQITISDTGLGIAKQNLSKIFDPFFTTKGKKRGTGLGLSVSYGIIKGHNGTIKVRSQPKKGSTFKIFLPVE